MWDQFFDMMFRTSAQLFSLIFIITSLVAVLKKEVFIGQTTEYQAKVATVLYAISCFFSLGYFILEHVGVNVHEIPVLINFLFVVTNASFILGILMTLRAGFTLIKKLRE